MEKSKQIDEHELRLGLSEFYGTVDYYQLGLYPDVISTEGIAYLAKEGKCFWLIDLLSGLLSKNTAFENEGMIFFKCSKNDDSSMTILCEDGNGGILQTVVISTVDFPLRAITLFSSFDGERWIILLPSEY